jgi:hypothetical protein
MFLKSLSVYSISANLLIFGLNRFVGKVFGVNMDVDEELRMRLLQEEFKLRKKQPEPWTKTKYRKYANFGAKKAKADAKQKA